MKPKDRKERYARLGGDALSVASPDDNPIDLTTASTDDVSSEKQAASTAHATGTKKKKSYNDEEIKLMAIKQAISMAKLFSDITTENIIELASIAASFIKHRKLVNAQ